MDRTTKLKGKNKSNKTNPHQVVNSRIKDKTTFFYYAFRNILLFSVPILIISSLVLSHLSLHSSATNSNSETDNLTLTLSTSCTLSSSVEEAHTASLNGGQYEDDIGITKVNAYCNDNNGYSIYAIGSSNNVDGNTDLISNINDNYNIHTGIYNSTSTSSYTPSSWSMKLSPGSGTGINPDTGASITVTPPTIRNNYNSYSIVPENYTLVASRSSNTNMTVDTNASGSYFTTTYDIYAASFQPSGTYTGKVKYLMMHPQSNIDYLSFNNVFAINNKTPARVDGEHIYYAMQDMSSDICKLVGLYNEASQTQLVDIRDNKMYWVAKLEDGHCWMTQNLDFDITAGTTEITSDNTDLSTDGNVYTADNTIYALKGTNDTYGYTYENGMATWIPERSTIAYDQLSSTTWSNSTTQPYSYDRLDTSTGANHGKSVYPDSNVTETIAGNHGLSGNYYNWTAAIASNNSNNTSGGGGAANSICPRGWRLPSAVSNDFGNLLVAYNIIATNTSTSYIENVSSVNSMGAAPLYLIRSANVVSGTIGNNGSGRYSSSTFLSGSSAYRLQFTSSSVIPMDSNSRGQGWTVRCLAR